MAFEQFPYTNLHDLNLDWLLARVKECADQYLDVKKTAEDAGKAVVSLREYVDNYFHNLDLTEEISDKIDQLMEDGELAEIVLMAIDAPFDAFRRKILAITASLRNVVVANKNAHVEAYLLEDDPETSDRYLGLKYSTNGRFQFRYNKAGGEGTSGLMRSCYGYLIKQSVLYPGTGASSDPADDTTYYFNGKKVLFEDIELHDTFENVTIVRKRANNQRIVTVITPGFIRIMWNYHPSSKPAIESYTDGNIITDFSGGGMALLHTAGNTYFTTTTDYDYNTNGCTFELSM